MRRKRNFTMKKEIMLFAIASVLCLVTSGASAWADHSPPSDNADLKKEVTDLQNRVTGLEQKIGPDGTTDNRLLQSALSGLQLSGGISAGSFYASNPGKDISDNEFLLSNFLVELSSTDANLPVGFVGAFGETSTPSLLSTPENNTTFDIEYASLTVKPFSDMHLEVGLLQPNAGFENTYTFNNINVMLGALASQQPYNAYGARLAYDVNGLHLCAGYYKKRLDDTDEYNDNGSTPGDSWEIRAGGSVFDNKFSVYHYHIEGHRNLTGAVVERTIKNVCLAVNIDYWNRDEGMRSFYESQSAIGGAFYVTPRFGHFSIPVRLEYIDQGESRIFINNVDSKRIYTATISPTYTFCENAYVRIESAYVYADNAFADKNGNSKNNRVCLTAEVGYLF